MIKYLRNNRKTVFLIITILLVIILVPPILGNNYSIDFFNLKNAGSIGDALGGITAPFINGLAAILVFAAFNEQVKANNLFKKQENIKMVFEQFKEIKTSHNKNITKLKEWKNEDSFYTLSEFDEEAIEFFNLLLLISSDLMLLCKLADNLEKDYFPFKSKIYYFYLTEIHDSFIKLKGNIEAGINDIDENHKSLVDNVFFHIINLENKIMGEYKSHIVAKI